MTFIIWKREIVHIKRLSSSGTSLTLNYLEQNLWNFIINYVELYANSNSLNILGHCMSTLTNIQDGARRRTRWYGRNGGWRADTDIQGLWDLTGRPLCSVERLSGQLFWELIQSKEIIIIETVNVQLKKIICQYSRHIREKQYYLSVKELWLRQNNFDCYEDKIYWQSLST